MAMDVAGTAILIQLCSIGAVILSILRPTKCSSAVLPLIAGLAGVVGYLAPAYQLGQNWQMHWVISILTLASALCVLIVAFIRSYKKTQAQVLAELEK
jgi:hypothetical protein